MPPSYPARSFSPIYLDERWRGGPHTVTVRHDKMVDTMRFHTREEAERYQEWLGTQGYVLHDPREAEEPVECPRYIKVYIKDVGNVIIDIWRSEEVARFAMTTYQKRKAKRYLVQLNQEAL